MTTQHEDLEDALREMLHRRAGDIRQVDPATGPTETATPPTTLGPRQSAGSGGRWVLVVAAVVAVAVGLGLAAAVGLRGDASGPAAVGQDIDTDVDPEFILNEPDEPAPPTELIIDERPAERAPEVPVGICDGLPDDPPLTGVGDGRTWANPEDALTDVIAAEGFPDLGYIAHVVAEDDIVYALPGHSEEESIIVIDLGLVDGRWVVERWAASPC